MAPEADAPIVPASWTALAARGATMAYGGHDAPTPLAHLLGMRTHG